MFPFWHRSAPQGGCRRSKLAARYVERTAGHKGLTHAQQTWDGCSGEQMGKEVEAAVDPISAAILGWLIEQAATWGGRKLERLLRGDKQANALRAIVAEAVQRAVDEVVAPADRTVVGEALTREGPSTAPIDLSDVRVLRDAVLCVISPQLTVLADQGYRVDTDRLAYVMAQKIRDGIQLNAARGGPLTPVADLLRHEELAGTSKRIAHAGERAATAGEETARELKEMHRTLRTLSQSRAAQNEQYIYEGPNLSAPTLPP